MNRFLLFLSLSLSLSLSLCLFLSRSFLSFFTHLLILFTFKFTQLEKKEKEDLEAQLAVLLDLEKNYEDAGPVYDCVVFNDGTTWRAAVDVSEKGDLASSVLLADYKYVFLGGVFYVHLYGMSAFASGRLWCNVQ